MPWSPPPLHPRRTGPRTDERASAAERGYDWTWATTAKAFLAATKAEQWDTLTSGRQLAGLRLEDVDPELAGSPLCVACLGQGRATKATLVDHVEPITGGRDDPRRLDWANLQALCRSCHAAKTHGDRKAGRTRRA